MFVSLISQAAAVVAARPGVLVVLIQLCSPSQAHILLSWQRDDGSESRALQGSLLDLEQLLGGVQQGNSSPTCTLVLLALLRKNKPLKQGFKLSNVAVHLQASLLFTVS